MPPDPDEQFEDLKRTFDMYNVLAAAFRQAEHHYETAFPEGGYLVTEVVRHAWNMLDEKQKNEQMELLFACFWHQQMAIRKSLELDGKAADGTSYLESGDLDIIDDTLSGALAIAQFRGDGSDIIDSIDGENDGRRLEQIFPDGMLPVDIELLQRLISQIELLQHRLDMREREQGKDGPGGT